MSFESIGVPGRRLTSRSTRTSGVSLVRWAAGVIPNQPQPRSPAETYEHYFVPAMFLPWATILLRHAAPQSRDRVLDPNVCTRCTSHRIACALNQPPTLLAADSLRHAA